MKKLEFMEKNIACLINNVYIAVNYCNMNVITLTKGDKYGMLTVIKEGIKLRLPSGQTNRTADCVCECGNKTNVRLVHLVRGRTISCGCIQRSRNGLSSSPIYKIWKAIKDRCDGKTKDAERYKGRGIKVCKEWENDFMPFYNWAKSNGYKKGLQIDRIDNNGNYSPENCRFVTPKENCNNREMTLYVDYKGEKISLNMLLQKLNYPNKYATVVTRLKRGWDVERALFKKPAKNYSGRNKEDTTN